MRPNSLSIPDARGQGATLRVTRHRAQRKIVLSHWRDGVCVASTPIELSEVPALIGVLADALGEAIDGNGHPSLESGSMSSPLSRIRLWLRPKLARVTELRLVREVMEEKRAG